MMLSGPIKNRLRVFGAALLALLVLIPLSRIFIAQTSWTFFAPLLTANVAGTSAVFTDGRVLLIGGDSDNSVDPDTCQIYDPHRDRWTPAASLDFGLSAHSVLTLPDNRVFVLTTDYYEIYDPNSNTWVKGKPKAINCTAQLTADGHVLIWNGRDAELVDPKTLTSRQIKMPRTEASGVGPSSTPLLKNRALFFDRGSIYICDTVSLLFKTCKTTYAPGAFVRPTLLTDGRVFCVVDTDPPIETIFNPDSDKWVDVTDPEYSPRESATPLPQGKVLLIGGQDGNLPMTLSQRLIQNFSIFPPAPPEGTISTARVFDPATGKFVHTPPLNEPRELQTTVLLPNNRILICGGKSSEADINTCEIIPLRALEP